MFRALSLPLVLSLALLQPARAPAVQPQGQPKNVLILNSYHPGFSWTDDLVTSISGELQRRYSDIELHVEYMDVKHFEERGQSQLFREFLPAKYARRRLDLIIATDDPALSFLANDARDLFPATPVVFCGVSNRELIASLDRKRFTGVQEQFDTRALIRMARRLRPSAKQFYVVLDATEQNHAFRAIYSRLFDDLPEVKPVYLQAGEIGLEGILSKLRGAPADSLVIAHSFTHDRGGVVVDMERTMAAITAASPVPVISPNTSVLGQGLLAGNANGGLKHGAFTARFAFRILAGEPPSAVPVEPEGGFGPVFDFAAMQRWGIGEDQLPGEAEVINRPMGLWGLYRRYVVLAVVLISAQMAIIGLLIWNMRARRKAEASLRQSEMRHRDMVENAIDAIYSHDLEGRFTSANRTLLELLGYSRDEILSMTIDQVVAPEHLETARRSIARKLADEKPLPYQIAVVCRDGRRIWVEVSTRLIRESGNPAGVEGIARDITTRKNLESQLRQAQKMDALGRLAGGVAHDFNNILTVICGYANLLLPEAASGRQRDRLDLIRKAGEQATQLTQQLLAFSRSQVAEPGPVNLNRVVNDMEKILIRLIGEDVALVTQLDPSLGSILGDAGQLGQVVMNLAVNARDAMPNGGKLIISTANGSPAGDGSCSDQPQGEGTHVFLTVTDTGEGMEPEVLRQAFEPFYTTKDEGRGTGLGLSVVYGIVKQYDGEVSVSSQPGAGTTFEIRFPRVPGEARPEAASREAQILAGRGTILVVEDREDVRRYAASVLSDAGYHVLLAAHGAEALSLIMNSSARPDLLLTDVIMPEMTGPELAARLAEIHPGVRVILMSGYTAGADLEDKYSKPLSKPFSPGALLDRVRAELDGAACG